MDTPPPRPSAIHDPPADDNAPRGPRKSRNQLRLPNDLTRMDAPDHDDIPSAEASAADTDAFTDTLTEGRSTIVSSPAPPAAEVTEPTPAPPRASVAPEGAEVEVTLDAANAVSVAPPPRSGPPPGPDVPGTMRVVRRKIRMVGQEDGGAGNAGSPSPQPAAAAAEGVRVPASPAPMLHDLGLDFSDAPIEKAIPESAPPPEPSFLMSEVSPEAPKRRSNPPPPPLPKRPSNPPPPPLPRATTPTTPAPAASSPPPLPRASTPATPTPAAVVSAPPPMVASAPPVAVISAPPPSATPPPVPSAVTSSPPPLPTAASRASQHPPRIEAPRPLESPTSSPPRVSVTPESTDDGSVEISIDEHGESSSASTPPGAPRNSLSTLDELAELAHETPAVSIDSEALEHVEAAPRGASIPPPPPGDVSRKTKGSPSIPASPPASKIAGGPTLPDARPRRRRMWWEELFNEDYFRTMERLTPVQVQCEADWIEHALGVEAGASILDVGCGGGRQAIELARRRYEMSGVDLSLPMLTRASEAAQEAGVKVSFTQADMATMDFEEAFDAAYCVGSSFGFFDDPRNEEVVKRIHRSLKPHGTVLLGVLNRDHAIQRQPAMSWFEGDGCVCMEESSFNFITSRLNVKRTMIYDDGRQREFEYSVRLYSLHELGQVLHDAGFRILEVSGHTRTPGAFFGPTSRELIILAQKRGSEVVDLNPNGEGAGDSSRP